MKFATTVCFAAMAHSTMAFAPVMPVKRASPSMVSTRVPSYLTAMNQNEEQPEQHEADQVTTKKYLNPEPVLVSALDKLVPGNMSPKALVSAALAAVLAFSLTFASPDAAWAARSGGRMGGSFGSAAPTMRSVPSRSSYGGGYGGGYRGGVTVAPIITPGPMISPFYGGGFGYGYGAGVLAPRGPSLFDLLFFGGFAFMVLSAFTSASRGIATSGTGLWTDSSSSVLGRGATVAKISVALEVPNRDDPNSILGVLKRLAQTARTDSRVGIQNLTSQVALELLRRKSSIVSAHSASNHFNDKTKAQRNFSSTAVQERGKFESETVSRYGGVDYGVSGGASGGDGAGKATMCVVTLVIAIDGDSTNIPSIRSVADVEQALQRIASDSKVEDCLQSAEILWTPEDRSETLSMRDVIADYPELRSV